MRDGDTQTDERCCDADRNLHLAIDLSTASHTDTRTYKHVRKLNFVNFNLTVDEVFFFLPPELRLSLSLVFLLSFFN